MHDSIDEIEAGVRRLLEADLQPHPHDIDTILFTAAVWRDAGDTDAALRRIEGILLWFPQHREALLFKARLLQKAGRFEDARRIGRQLVDTVATKEAGTERACALFELAHVEHASEAFALAECLYTQGIDLLENTGSEAILAAEYLNRARTRKQLQKLPEAIRDCGEAIRLCGSVGLPDMEAMARFEAGLLQMDSSLLDEASASLSKAKTRFRQMGLGPQLRDCCLALAILYRRKGQSAVSARAYLRAIAIARKLKDTRSLANAYALLAKTFILLGSKTKASACYRESIRVLEAEGHTDVDRVDALRTEALTLGLRL